MYKRGERRRVAEKAFVIVDSKTDLILIEKSFLVGDGPFGTYAQFSEKLTFLTP